MTTETFAPTVRGHLFPPCPDCKDGVYILVLHGGSQEERPCPTCVNGTGKVAVAIGPLVRWLAGLACDTCEGSTSIGGIDTFDCPDCTGQNGLPSGAAFPMLRWECPCPEIVDGPRPDGINHWYELDGCKTCYIRNRHDAEDCACSYFEGWLPDSTLEAAVAAMPVGWNIDKDGRGYAIFAGDSIMAWTREHRGRHRDPAHALFLAIGASVLPEVVT